MISSSGLAMENGMRLPWFSVDTYPVVGGHTRTSLAGNQRRKGEKNSCLILLFIERKTEQFAYGHTARSYSSPNRMIGIWQAAQCWTKNSGPEDRKNQM